MARVILLTVGTVLAVLFLIQLKRGKNYDEAVSVLDGMEYPLCSLYVAGFAWSSRGPLRFRGKLAAKLKREAAILFKEQFADYYANIAWVQAITLVHLTLTLAFLLAGLFFSTAGFIMAVGIFIAVFMGVYSLTNMSNTLSKRTEECDAKLPDVVSSMAVLLNSGMVLRDVWRLVSESGDSTIYQLMRKASDDMNNGVPEVDAMYQFGLLSGSLEVKKFTSAMLQSLEKGGSELTLFMERQSSELWAMKRQKMLQSGEKAATKLLVPTMLVFVGILIIVITAAFAGALF
ncbi:MAG: type II secretion system F family protein [Clostridiales bacterium]|nr:type II secretion system F family protein [Clostridiales bacterium]